MATLSDYEAEQLRKQASIARIAIRCTLLTLLVLVALYFLFRWVNPQLNLYKANTEKQAQIAQSKAKAAAAEYEAQAEIARAHGVAESNRIIAGSITEPYLRYLYIQSLDVAGAQVIYVPTEAGLPILEAGRAVDDEEGDETP